MLKHFTKYFCYFLIMVLACISLSLMMIFHTTALNNVGFFIKAHHLYFIIWRYLFMGALVVAYPYLMRWYYANKDVDPELLRKYSSRGYIIAFLGAAELLVGMNVVGFIVRHI